MLYTIADQQLDFFYSQVPFKKIVLGQLHIHVFDPGQKFILSKILRCLLMIFNVKSRKLLRLPRFGMKTHTEVLSQRFPMDILWQSYGNPIEILQKSQRFPIEILWQSHRFPMEIPQISFGNPIGTVADIHFLWKSLNLWGWNALRISL